MEALLVQKFKSVEELINQLKPEQPVYCIRKNSIQTAVHHFKKNFPGKILYAVKTNSHPGCGVRGARLDVSHVDALRFVQGDGTVPATRRAPRP